MLIDNMYALLPNEGEGVGSEQIDRIIVGSSKTRKQKKKTSRSEHQKKQCRFWRIT